MRHPFKKNLWVIKIGSQLISDGGPLFIDTIIHQVKKLKTYYKIEIICVTSGAIAIGREYIGISGSKTTKLKEKQALSAIGQPLIMKSYEDALNRNGLMGAQVLVSYDDFKNNLKKANLKNTLEQLLKWGVVPILNENDATSTEEIQFGDNDFLSAKTAILMNAKNLVLLTDVPGILGYDSKINEQYLIKEVINLKKLPRLARPTAQKAALKAGTGGIESKLKSAAEAQKAKIDTWIIDGFTREILLKIARNENPGTFISGE